MAQAAPHLSNYMRWLKDTAKRMLAIPSVLITHAFNMECTNQSLK